MPALIALSIVPDALSAIRARQHLGALLPVQLATARIGEDGVARPCRVMQAVIR
jgi:hypothetical protein